jgi:hypothetical protein
MLLNLVQPGAMKLATAVVDLTVAKTGSGERPVRFGAIAAVPPVAGKMMGEVGCGRPAR